MDTRYNMNPKSRSKSMSRSKPMPKSPGDALSGMSNGALTGMPKEASNGASNDASNDASNAKSGGKSSKGSGTYEAQWLFTKGSSSSPTKIEPGHNSTADGIIELIGTRMYLIGQTGAMTTFSVVGCVTLSFFLGFSTVSTSIVVEDRVL